MTATARPGQHETRAPRFNLVILSALADWRHALRARAEARERFSRAVTPHEKTTAVQQIDRYSAAALRAERRLRDALLEDVEG